MSELEIPERARDSVLRAAWPVTNPSPESVTEALHVAAPIIVAAELRRLANSWNTGWDSEAAEFAERLHARAIELDPEGSP